MKIATFKERMNEALKFNKMKKIDLAEKLNLHRGTISTYASGGCEPKAELLYQMANALNVDPAWLMGYDVPMEKTTIVNLGKMNETARAKVNDVLLQLGCNNEEIALIYDFINATRYDKDVFNDYLQLRLLDKQKVKTFIDFLIQQEGGDN